MLFRQIYNYDCNPASEFQTFARKTWRNLFTRRCSLHADRAVGRGDLLQGAHFILAGNATSGRIKVSNICEDMLDFLQDGAVELAGWRNRGEAAEKANGAAEQALEGLWVDELAQVPGAPCCRKDEHVAELSG